MTVDSGWAALFGALGIQRLEAQSVSDLEKELVARGWPGDVVRSAFASASTEPSGVATMEHASRWLAVTFDGLHARALVADRPPSSRKSLALHELANALTVARGWADLTTSAGELSTAGARRTLGLIAESARQGLAVAQAIEHRENHIGSCAATEIVTRVVDTQRPLATERDVALTLDAEPRLHIGVPTHVLHAIVLNLTKNAIEATPAGGTVSVRAWKSGAVVTVAIDDEGSGFAHDLDGGSTKGEGRGLGLKVVDELIRGAGGGLRYASRADGGTSALVTLAAAPAVPKALKPLEAVPTGKRLAPEREKPSSGVRARRLSVLVVEDDIALADMMAAGLSRQRHSVTVARSIADTLALADERFDVAFIDRHLDGNDIGSALVRIVRSRSMARMVIAMTGEPTSIPGTDMILPKPFSLDDVLGALDELAPRIAKLAGVQ